jgi:membrane protein implicated in regulation of membrane protease activity
VLAERLVIEVTPKVSAAALTFRELMPIVPLFALVAGGGIWAAAGALALLIPSTRPARAVVAVLTSAVLVTFWSPFLRERMSNQPLLGRVADRGADPTKAEGLRVEVLVGAQDWLQTNLQHNDLILTGIPRQLGWYADLSADDMANLIDLNSQDRTQEQRRAYILDRVGPRGVMYVIDFNVYWTDPGSDNARQWRQTYETLASKPNLETAYVMRDRFNNPVFYVIRNHGYATAPGH